MRVRQWSDADARQWQEILSDGASVHVGALVRGRIGLSRNRHAVSLPAVVVRQLLEQPPTADHRFDVKTTKMRYQASIDADGALRVRVTTTIVPSGPRVQRTGDLMKGPKPRVSAETVIIPARMVTQVLADVERAADGRPWLTVPEQDLAVITVAATDETPLHERLFADRGLS